MIANNHTINLIDAEKSLDKIQHLFLIKNAQQIGYMENTLHNKGTLQHNISQAYSSSHTQG